MNNNNSDNIIKVHPNGQPVRVGLKRPLRDDRPFFEEIFPANDIGRILKGLCLTLLIKQEHRIGWARKSACSDSILLPYPNETVASHMFGVAFMVTKIAVHPKFQEENPNFNRLLAIDMALAHDVAELITGDITPVDGISQEEKHKLEKDAMDKIISAFPSPLGESLNQDYSTYELRTCPESKFVKDCDKLDFIISAFILERQGFGGFAEFYSNSIKEGFSTKIAQELATTLIETREDLLAKGTLYKKSD